MAAPLSPSTPQMRRPMFKATQLWHTIITYLHRNVAVKKRRHLMKTFDDCFTGSDAVSVILRYLLSDNINFAQDISRLKAQKLCQLLMESHVFEPVSKEKEDRDSKFEDSHSKFYRFLHVHGHAGALPAGQSPKMHHLSVAKVGKMSRITGDVEPNLLDGSDTIGNPVVVTRQGLILQEIMNITSSYRRRSAEILRSMSPARLLKMTRQSSSLEGGGHVLSSEEAKVQDSSAILKQAALVELLRLVDLPFLDDILQLMNEPLVQHAKSMVIENTEYGPFSPDSDGSFVCKKQYDQWTQAALECLEFHPKGDSILCTLQNKYTQGDGPQFKSELFTFICNHYSNRSEPLLSGAFVDIHLAALNRFMQCRVSEAVTLLQLSFVLLPSTTSCELERLLTFIKMVLDDDVTINPFQSNQSLVDLHLVSSVIRNKWLSNQQAAQLVRLMLDHLVQLFEVPDIVQNQMKQRDSARYTPVKPVHVYCKQISRQEFVQEQKDFTSAMLVDMMNSILDDTKLTLKDKQQKLRQFQKQYPELYSKHFADIE